MKAADDLTVQIMGAETLLYKSTTNEVHLLDERASAILRRSAVTNVLELARELYPELAEEAACDIVRQTQATLVEKGLLLAEPGRRQFVKSLVSATLLPTIVSTLAPQPAAALSSCPQNSYSVPVAAMASGSTSTSTGTPNQLTSRSICVRSTTSNVAVTFGALTTNIDDTLCIQTPANTWRCYSPFAVNSGNRCGSTLGVTTSITPVTSMTVNIPGSEFTLPASGIANRTLNFYACNYVGATAAPTVTVVVT